jgi:uncharacterized membrane protein
MHARSHNQKTLTLDHIARIAARHPTMVEVGRFYGLTFASIGDDRHRLRLGLHRCVGGSGALVAHDHSATAMRDDRTRTRSGNVCCNTLVST